MHVDVDDSSAKRRRLVRRSLQVPVFNGKNGGEKDDMEASCVYDAEKDGRIAKRSGRVRISGENIGDLMVMVHGNLGRNIGGGRRESRDAFPTLFSEKAPLWVFSVCRHFLVYESGNGLKIKGKSDYGSRFTGTSGTVYGNLSGHRLRFPGIYGADLRGPSPGKVPGSGNLRETAERRCLFPGTSGGSAETGRPSVTVSGILSRNETATERREG